MSLVRHDGHPDRGAQRGRRGAVDELRVRPGQRGADHAYVQYVSPVVGVRDELVKLGGDAAALADSPLLFPDDDDAGPAARVRRPARRARPGRSPTASSRSRAAERGRPPPPTTGALRSGAVRAVPDVAARAAVPLPVLPRPARHAAQDRPVGAHRERQPEGRLPVGVGNFSKAFTDFGPQLWRAFAYAGVATVLCVLIAYPIAYFIAFKAGKWAQPAARAGDGAVLHQLPAAHDRLAVAVRRQRPDPRHRRRACGLTGVTDALHITTDGKIMNTPAGRDRRPDVQLPAVRPAADLRQPGEDRASTSSTRRPTCTRTSRARSAR